MQPGGLVAQFTQGFGMVGRAFGLFTRSSRLRRLAVIPTLISTLLLAALVYLSIRYGGALVDRFWAVTPGQGWRASLLGGAHSLTQVLITLLLLLLSGALFFIGAQVIAEPFIDLLADATEREVGLTVPQTRFSLRLLLRDLWLVLRDVALDLSLFAVAQLLVFLLNFVPVVGSLLHLVLGWSVNATFAGLEMTGMSLARRQIRGRQRWRALRANRAQVLGLGSAVMLLLLVPLAQLLTLPLAVVAGTLLVVELERQGRLRRPGHAPAEGHAT